MRRAFAAALGVDEFGGDPTVTPRWDRAERESAGRVLTETITDLSSR
jgi:hypothetical protein